MTDNRTAGVVAATIKQQIGWASLATVGASQFLITNQQGGGLVFTARLHHKGQTAIRKMRVEIVLNGRDEYDVMVGYEKKFQWVKTVELEGVQAEQLSQIVRDWDLKGV